MSGSVNYFGHLRATNAFIRQDMQGDARTYRWDRSTVYPETFTHEVSDEAPWGFESLDPPVRQSYQHQSDYKPDRHRQDQGKQRTHGFLSSNPIDGRAYVGIASRWRPSFNANRCPESDLAIAVRCR
jgi:hypothetical protein